MRNVLLAAAVLLCSLNSASASEFRSVAAQSGEDVTLRCSNFSSAITQIFWFRVVKGSKPSFVSFIFDPRDSAKYFGGFRAGRFEMTSNESTIFLKIKTVNSSDSGLYFCGYKMSKSHFMGDATNLDVPEEAHGPSDIRVQILGAATLLLVIVVIFLAVKIQKLRTAAEAQNQNPQRTKRQGSDDVDYAAVAFQPNAERNLRPSPDRDVEPNVLYSAIRSTQ